MYMYTFNIYIYIYIYIYNIIYIISTFEAHGSQHKFGTLTFTLTLPQTTANNLIRKTS